MCDDSVNVKPHQTKRRKHQPKKEWKPIKRVWKPISKPVANSKPQWKPTGRHFSLFEKYPLTRIMEPTDMPIELPPGGFVQKGSLVVQIVLWYLDSGPPSLAMVIINWGTLSSLESTMLKDSSTTYSRSYSKVHDQTTCTLNLLSEMICLSASPVCLLTKASSTKSWLWHRRLNHLNFGTLNGFGSEKSYFSFGTKDETPQVIEKFIVKSQRALNATVRFVRTDNGTEFVNKTLDGWFESVGISHETSVPRSPTTERRMSKRTEPKILWKLLVLCSSLRKAPLVPMAEASFKSSHAQPNSPILQSVWISVGYPTRWTMMIVGKLKAECRYSSWPRSSHTNETSGQNSTELETVDDLFQWFDDDEVVPIPPVVPITPVNVPAAPAPENANGSPSTTVISEGAPAVTENLLPHQIPLPDTSDSDDETLFDHVGQKCVWTPHNAPENEFKKASHPLCQTSRLLPNKQLPHVHGDGLQDTSALKTLLGLKTRTYVSTRETTRNRRKCGVSYMNSSRLVAKGYRQERWYDFEDSFAIGCRLESIRSSCSRGKLNMVVFQMEVKNRLLNGELYEVVSLSVNQKGFVDPEHPSHVYASRIALLWTQTSSHCAWYDKLFGFLISQDLQIGRGRSYNSSRGTNRQNSSTW
ncbi:retrovirus-related pol polyprotein from transposon TNT 1-94 [Tanacetum coccineum]